MSEITINQNQELYLAIDQGGHASRVMVFDSLGNVMTQASSEVAASRPKSGWVEQDGEVLVLSIREAIDEIAMILGKKCKDIVAAGLATQRSNVVCWNRETGKLLSPVISWQDRRAFQWMQQFDRHAKRIRQITGLLPTAHYGVSKLVWCLENLPAVEEARANKNLAWGPLSSYLLYQLLDEKRVLVDPANASRTLLWDVEQCIWSEELLKLFGISADTLPECVTSRYNFGSLDIGEVKVPLTVCTGDQSAALFAFGKPESGVASVNIGTGAFLQTVITEYNSGGDGISINDPVLAYPERLLRSVVWSDASGSMVVSEATVNGAGSAVQLVEAELGISPQKAQKYFPSWLATTKNIPLYLNGVSGLGSPFWVSDFVSRFVGDGEPPEKMVAVIESIVFLLQVNLETMQANEVKLDRIIVSGGLSVLNGLCQRLADLSKLPVCRPQQCEATAKGLAFLISGQEHSWQAGGRKDMKLDDFKPALNDKLSDRYRHWREELEAELEARVL